jgi:hypothetical protein
MRQLNSPASLLAGCLLALVLAATGCGPGFLTTFQNSGERDSSAGATANLPLTVGTQFLQTLMVGNTDGAAAMLAAYRQSEATTKFLAGMSAALQGCASSGTQFSSGTDRGAPIISVVFTPACGHLRLMYPNYAGRSPDEPVASCQVWLESVAGQWKPRSDTTDCQSPSVASAATGNTRN